MSGPEKKNKLIEKALKDPKFKAQLLANPNAAVEKATGVKIPDGVKVKVLEDTTSVVHLVLPPGLGMGELLESDTGKVAGAAGLSPTMVRPCSENNSAFRGPCQKPL